MASLETSTSARQTDDTLELRLANGTHLRFALGSDRTLFGMRDAGTADLSFKQPETVVFPLLAEEWTKERAIMPFGRLESVEEDGTGGFRVHTTLLGAHREDLYRAFFVCRESEGERAEIFRDLYCFAHLRVPAEVSRLTYLQGLQEEYADALEEVGRLTWHLRPATRNIAGWSWEGFSLHFSFELKGGRKVNVLRWLGTWELGGTLVGSTVASLRYRGLGRIEQDFSQGPEGGVDEAWSTTEVLPGWADGTKVAVSPAIPQSSGHMDRGYALKHRAATWIIYPARGAGAPFVDFQFRKEGALCSFTEKQGNLRGMSETFPGDTGLAQTDEEWFALSGEGTTTPRLYLGLSAPQGDGFDRAAWRTRWREVDRFVRDTVSAELGYEQVPVQPTVGELWDIWGRNGDSYVPLMERMQERSSQWQEQGVRWVITHNSGNVDGRSVGKGWDGAEQFEQHGGLNGNCLPYDWLALPGAREPWKRMYDTLKERGMDYFIWLTGMCVQGGPFSQRVGLEKEHWSQNAPDGETQSQVYAGDDYSILKYNPRDEVFLRELERTLAELDESAGFDGFWIDSYQNLFMSQMSWADGSGEALQRRWWEKLAEWTRQGRLIIAESHSFPGISCSIEVPDWEKDHWYFLEVCRWHRGNEWERFSEAERDSLSFRFLANRSWTAPEMLSNPCREPREAEDMIPSFSRHCHEYLAALPAMKRDWVLGEPFEGILWLGESGASEGLWFPFAEANVPGGVTATYILDEAATPVSRVKAEHTYRVQAEDLPRAFGLARGPLEDPREA